MTAKENLIEKAKALVKNEEFGKAIRILEELYQQQSDVEVKNNLIDALFAYGGYLNDYYVLEYDESINFFKRIIELDSENYRAHYNLGIAYFNLNRFEEAINSYKIALTIKPDHKHVYYNIGLLYEKTENLEKAI
ncbi:MAG: tetratricopeptide repeat protein, partial [Candidatus Lokiarchaeota archaeon]|nr:tetratricopeptide repeat protein [Candidatus Lokiarchaeota archaeon]